MDEKKFLLAVERGDVANVRRFVLVNISKVSLMSV